MKTTADNTFIRYADSLNGTEPQYVVDLDGGLHYISDNVQAKLNSVDKSRVHWEKVLKKDPKNTLAMRFSIKFSQLAQQIEILIESNEVVALN